MLKKLFIIFILFILLVTGAQASNKICPLIDSLKGDDFSTLENIKKTLGVDEALTPTKIQVIKPFVEKVGSDLFIFALSYEGPLHGYIVLTNSDGDILDKQKVGYIKSISLHSSENDTDDRLIIDATTGIGTGTRSDYFYIFSIDNKFKELWKALSYQRYMYPVVTKTKSYEIFGNFQLDSIGNDKDEEIVYTKKYIEYFWDEKLQEFKQIKSETENKTYKFIDGKYVVKE
jgi:hypothetical protein